MDILYACTLYPPAIGGAQIHLHCLARQMQALGQNVRVMTSAMRNRTDWLKLATVRPEPQAEQVHEGVPVTQLGYSATARLRMLPWAATYYATMQGSVEQVARIIGREIPWPPRRPAIVHVSRVGREFLARAALDYAQQRGIPYVLTPNHHPRWRGYLYTEYDRIYRQADAVLALTQAERQTLVTEKGIDESRVHVTGIGPVLADDYSAEEFREKHGLVGQRFVLYLGQQLKYKGIGALVESAPMIWKKHPDVRLVFVGPPSAYSRRLFAQVRDSRMINLGSVSLRDKTSALAACELLCLPSMQESFGGVFVEAWSLRKPVVGGRIGPIANVIDEGVNGLLATQEPDDLADAVCQMLCDEQRSVAMGQSGYEKVQARYSWEQIARRTLRVYESLAESGSRRAHEGLPILANLPERRPWAMTHKAFAKGQWNSDEGNTAQRATRNAQRPLRVLLSHNYYKLPGGEDLSFADEARMLESRGHEVQRYTLHNDAIDSMGGIGASQRAVWNADAYRRIGEIIHQLRPDVVHCTNTFPLISPAVYYAARRAGVPVVQSLRNYRVLCLNATFLRDGKVCEDCLGRSIPWPGVVHGCYRENRAASAVVATMSGIHRALRTWTRTVDLYYTLTEFSRLKFIQGGLPADRIATKQNFVDPDPHPGTGDGGYVVFAGRLAHEKGIETMLAAWNSMRNPPRLKIVGDGPLADQVRAAGASNPSIEWMGFRPLGEVLSIIGSARCLLMPSIWYETFGRTIIEAFAKGTPVIASRLGAMQELVDHGRTGLHFEPGNADDLCAKVRQLFDDSDSALRMRRAARDEYESKYTADINYRSLIRIYERAMELHRPPHATNSSVFNEVAAT